MRRFSNRFRTGAWDGSGERMEKTTDLGRNRTLAALTIGALLASFAVGFPPPGFQAVFGVLFGLALVSEATRLDESGNRIMSPFLSATIAVAFLLGGPIVATLTAVLAALTAFLGHSILLQKRLSWQYCVSFTAGPAVASFVGSAVANGSLQFQSQTVENIVRSLLFIGGWYFVVFTVGKWISPGNRHELWVDAPTSLWSSAMLGPISFGFAFLFGEVATGPNPFYIMIAFFPIVAFNFIALKRHQDEEADAHTLVALGRMLQRVHPYGPGHMQRVGNYGRRIALAMKVPAHRVRLVHQAAILHDVGKIAVDERLLERPGPLTPAEYDHVCQHAEIGAKILSSANRLKPLSHWVRHHHEWVNGKGYPDRLSGVDIPLESRIIAVVDAYDAMVGGNETEPARSYRKRMSPQAAVQELRRCSGTQFDPQVVTAFCKLIEEENK